MSSFVISATAHSLPIGKFQSNIWLHFYDWFNLGFPHFYITFYHYLTFLPLLSSSPENPGFLFFFVFILNPILRARFSFTILFVYFYDVTLPARLFSRSETTRWMPIADEAIKAYGVHSEPLRTLYTMTSLIQCFYIFLLVLQPTVIYFTYDF